MSTPDLPVMTPAQVRQLLLDRQELALVDVREEDPFAQAHPLWAVQIGAGRIALDAPWRLPRRDVTIAVYDNGEGLAAPAALELQALGYTRVHVLDGGLAGWRDAGGELFRDVNVPSKSFGELVEHERHTPSLPAEEVKALLDAKADVVVLDARRFDEYATMSIPGGTSVPGAELALRVRDLAPNPNTRVIVNCAGRTRSIIGTQSLVNAGIPNPVAALRNGTIGWLLAGQVLDHGAQRRFGGVSPANLAAARASAQALADRAGAVRLTAASLAAWEADTRRTLYRWDVRTPEEYAAGHLPGFGSAPGGQLVQETDVCAAVRGARIALADGGPASDGVRAAMTAHWLAQMGWEVGWLTDQPSATTPEQHTAHGPWQPPHAPLPDVPQVDVPTLAAWRDAGRTLLLDVGTSAAHVKGHVPGAHWLLRTDLRTIAPELPVVDQLVFTCGDGRLARLAAADFTRLTGRPAHALAGGTAAWVAAGAPLEPGEANLLSLRIDRYRRPYEGTDAPREAMQGYLDWEFGLVAQLGRDGTHHFRVLPAA
ncbi:rhodanese-like domain-containing protein [Pseudaquabacterium pictum]|uniref:Sulfurtransferase n=1 Tax=Pseudaquabacterium pictum TaxID=2315236 RepID=A0A480AMN6_9BURK|nr:rhodanese-like domain-containing protein [Rubrivivax pictus]GCL61292.1 sulfurtransferase [Rubrivivax pictus]